MSRCGTQKGELLGVYRYRRSRGFSDNLPHFGVGLILLLVDTCDDVGFVGASGLTWDYPVCDNGWTESISAKSGWCLPSLVDADLASWKVTRL